MATVTQTVGAFMASFFGKSEKVISEKLTTDEHNQFTSDVKGLQEKITGLENKVTGLEGEKTTLATEKATLEGEKATLEASVNTLKGEKTKLEGDKTTLQNSLTSTEGERDKYKAWFEKQAGVGAQLPEGDATSKGEQNLTSYNQHALDVYRKANR